MEITSLNQLDLVNGIYSYADYLVWKIKERVELLKGKILEMSVPSPIHQEISGNLQGALFVFLKTASANYIPPPLMYASHRKGKAKYIL